MLSIVLAVASAWLLVSIAAAVTWVAFRAILAPGAGDRPSRMVSVPPQRGPGQRADSAQGPWR